MTQATKQPSMDAIVSLCRRRGFIFQSSEIYGGINGFFDYGPLGVEMRKNVKEAWWKDMVHRRDDMVGLDCSIIMHPDVWKASGHLDGFSDPMVDCRTCKSRFRADQLDEIPCTKKPSCKAGEHSECDLTEERDFNLMFSTKVGAMQDESSTAYLRPETAQGIFANFKNITDTSRVKLPFGIAQIGKAFRNEITPRNYIFRSREFEQMEIEYFISPEADWETLHQEWVEARLNWHESIGLSRDRLGVEVHPKEKLAHYARACTDVTFHFPFGEQELEGIAARGNFDLTQHAKASGKSMEYFDESNKQKYIPHVIEPSLGVDRTMLALLCNAYCEEEVPGDKEGKVEQRTVLKLHPRIAPIKAAVLPLVKNKEALTEKAKGLYKTLQRRWNVFYDASGAIGRRYRRMDEAGTPFCITIDFDTIEKDDCVTIRDRDTLKQERISIDAVVSWLEERIDL